MVQKENLYTKFGRLFLITGIEFDSVLDIFGGTGTFAYFAKKHNKEVIYNDIFRFNYNIGKKLIEQSSNELSLPEAIELLKVNPNIEYKSTIADNFKDIYFTDEENKQIDVFIQNANLLENENKRLSAFYILYQSCIIRGHTTFSIEITYL